MDTLTPQQRSERMARIRGADTAPELALRSQLHRLGLRFRKNDKRLPGKPDMVFKRWRAAVFVHGCFWHQHAGCKVAHIPRSNTEYWRAKLEANVQRDQRKEQALREMGWRVLVAWECELDKDAELSTSAQRIATWIRTLPSSE